MEDKKKEEFEIWKVRMAAETMHWATISGALFGENSKKVLSNEARRILDLDLKDISKKE